MIGGSTSTMLEKLEVVGDAHGHESLPEVRLGINSTQI